MSRRCALLCDQGSQFLTPASPPSASQIVQQANNTAINASSVTATLSAKPSASHFLCVVYGGYHGVPSSLTPSGGNMTFTLVESNGSEANVAFWLAPSDGTTQAITVTSSAGTGDAKNLWIAELTGDYQDSGVTTNGSDTNASPDTITAGTSTVANALWLVGFNPKLSTGTITPVSVTNGFTVQVAIAGAGSDTADGLVVATQTVSAVGTLSTAISFTNGVNVNGWISAGLYLPG